MSKDAKELERLAKELADLTPEERAKVLVAAERARFRPPPSGWRPKVLTGSKCWDGGPLTREDLYDDDGR